MKNKLALSFILFAFYSFVFTNAQNKFQPEFAIGIKAGANFSNIGLDTLLDQKYQSGYNGGIVFTFIAEPHLGIQVELNYTQKGWTEKIDTSDSYTRKINYLEIPFLSRIEIGVRKTRFYVNLGPFLSYKIDEKSIFNEQKVIKDYYKNSIDNNLGYGLCGGIGLEQKTIIGNFEIEFRFIQDLGDIFSPDHYSTFTRSQNKVISFDLIYLIGL